MSFWIEQDFSNCTCLTSFSRNYFENNFFYLLTKKHLPIQQMLLESLLQKWFVQNGKLSLYMYVKYCNFDNPKKVIYIHFKEIFSRTNVGFYHFSCDVIKYRNKTTKWYCMTHVPLYIHFSDCLRKQVSWNSIWENYIKISRRIQKHFLL